MSQSNFNEVRLIFDIIRRRKRLLVIVIFCGIMLTLLPVFLLKPVYKSTATILIESQEIPKEFVRSTVTGYIEERLQSITQIALNRANLLGMVEQFNLYNDRRASLTNEELVELMRKDIEMTPIQADVMGTGGMPVSATIAFSLSYKSKTPRNALNTTNALVSLFLEENYKNRESRAMTTFGFLEKQTQDLSQKISVIEEDIARFKELHLTALPEMVTLNLQNLERTQREIESKRTQLRNLNDRKIYLEGQLATLSPTRPYAGNDGRVVLKPAEELKVLRTQYISLRATRSEKHPDIISLKQKISALEAHVGDNETAIEDLVKLRTTQEAKIAALRGQYTDNHPEVQAAENELTAVNALIDDARRNKGNKTLSDEVAPDNPAYITIEAQLKSAILEIESEKRDIDDLEQKYSDYQKRVELSPQVEQDYRKLQRDLAITQAQYQESMAKLMAAREAKILEEERAGERLTLVDPPMLPESPISPNRILILFIGCILSVAAGGGSVALLEIMDGKIHGLFHLPTITKVPVLVSIPYYATKQEKRKRTLQRKIILISGLVILIGMIIFCHFVFMPLDVLFYTIQNKLKLYF